MLLSSEVHTTSPQLKKKKLTGANATAFMNQKAPEIDALKQSGQSF